MDILMKELLVKFNLIRMEKVGSQPKLVIKENIGQDILEWLFLQPLLKKEKSLPVHQF